MRRRAIGCVSLECRPRLWGAWQGVYKCALAVGREVGSEGGEEPAPDNSEDDEELEFDDPEEAPRRNLRTKRCLCRQRAKIAGTDTPVRATPSGDPGWAPTCETLENGKWPPRQLLANWRGRREGGESVTRTVHTKRVTRCAKRGRDPFFSNPALYSQARRWARR